jgi:hypothetical protein
MQTNYIYTNMMTESRNNLKRQIVIARKRLAKHPFPWQRIKENNTQLLWVGGRLGYVRLD